MSISQSIIGEIQQELDSTRRVLAVITDEHLNWTPHQKSMTLGALTAHVVELHNWIGNGLNSEGIDFATGYQPLAATSVAELRAALEDGVAKNMEVINSLSDENWQENWTLSAGDHVIMSLPKIAALRFLIQNHLIHHRGQLTVYLRMLDLPVPGLYGPSADER